MSREYTPPQQPNEDGGNRPGYEPTPGNYEGRHDYPAAGGYDAPVYRPQDSYPPQYGQSFGQSGPNQGDSRRLTDIRIDQPKRGGWVSKAGGLGALLLALLAKGKTILLILLNFKWIALLLKFGFSGLSILLSVGLYAALYGWAFGFGIVALIFVHEMGHAIVLKLKGIPSSLPIFIPFLGAFIAMRQMPHNAKDEAEVGIGGPLLGTIGAAFCYVFYYFSHGNLLWIALAHFGFLINLFNLIPVRPLDGGRIVAAISKYVWVLGFLILLGVFFYTGNLFLLFILFLGGIELVRGGKTTAQMASYFKVPASTRIMMAIGYFGLIAFLVIGMRLTQELLPTRGF